MATTPATAPAHVQTEQVITRSSTSVAGKPTIGFGAELNTDQVQRTLDAQRKAKTLRREHHQRSYTQRQAVEQQPKPKYTSGQLLYSAGPDGVIMLHAYALELDRA